jgi:hypothetical protein
MENSEARKRKEEAKHQLTPVDALRAVEDSLKATIEIVQKIVEALEGRSNASDKQN